mmetsp:Transcript_4270/g.6810  ORF Transcript_4270/g.6810 Transcript_4270/m.6810 type:complete len:418 (-) Transcript_4270:175-1428(-)
MIYNEDLSLDVTRYTGGYDFINFKPNATLLYKYDKITMSKSFDNALWSFDNALWIEEQARVYDASDADSLSETDKTFNIIVNAGILLTVLLSLNASHVSYVENKITGILRSHDHRGNSPFGSSRVSSSWASVRQINGGTTEHKCKHDCAKHYTEDPTQYPSTSEKGEGIGSLHGNQKRKVKLLAAFSSPSHATVNGTQIAVEGLRLMSEMRSFQKVFPSESIMMLPAAAYEDLVSALNVVDPEILHLSGHCLEGKWVFEGDSREVSCVPGRKLGKLLSTVKTLNCIVLSGCRSIGIGETLRKYVPKRVRIVCSSTKLNNTFASEFCSEFYRQLEKKNWNAGTIDDCYLNTKSMLSCSSRELKFGDPSKHLHVVVDGVPLLDFNHLGEPHEVGPDGVPIYSQSCRRCNPKVGGVFTML